MKEMLNDQVLLDLIEQNEKLVYKIASRFYNVELDDLYQLGIMGLIKAYKNFKSNSDTKFSTYAYDYIYGEMYQALKHNTNFKVNKETLKLYKAIIKTYDFLSQKLNKIPTLSDVADYMNLDESIIKQTTIIMNGVKSLDELVNENSDLYNIVGDYIDSDDKILIDQSLNNLNENEQQIIKHRYFQDMTQSETAEMLGMSQVAVSRAESKCLSKMRSYMLN